MLRGQSEPPELQESLEPPAQPVPPARREPQEQLVSLDLQVL
ncbi:hypothetical protein I4300191C4_12930 [Solibaculum mannosilyticum]